MSRRQDLLEIFRFTNMQIAGAFVVILLSITLVDAQGVGVATNECPPCAVGDDCTTIISVEHLTIKDCTCSLCIKQCYDRKPKCAKGEECVMEPIPCIEGFSCKENDKVLSAVCKKFVACKALPETCTNACPESDKLKDQNGCETCLCNDPCKELKCAVQGDCIRHSADLDVDPIYECPKK